HAPLHTPGEEHVGMETNHPTTGRIARLFGKTFLGLVVLCGVTNITCSQEKGPVASYDVLRKRLTPIEPGTVIEDQAPKGWSHLIVKNRSKVGAGDVGKMTDQTKYLASFLFSAIVADVQPERQGDQVRYRLVKVGAGIGMKIRGKDTIITSA